jgi:hypothetical protein
MNSKARTGLVAFFVLAFPVAVFLAFLVSDLNSPLPPVKPLPNPNGYEDLVKAGGMVSTNSWNYDSADLGQLRETAAANAEALVLARSALSNECRVPLQSSQSYMEKHISDLLGVRKLALAFATEGRLAEMENRPDDAVKSYLDAVRLGDESARGGVLVDQMVGTAIEAIGTTCLTNLVGRLDAKSCRETAAALEKLDAQSQTWDQVMQQEQDWSRRTFTGIRYEMVRLWDRKLIAKAVQRAGQKFQEQQMKTRRLIVDLAARAYELEKDRPPASLADLVPEYLVSVPQDPLTGTNMTYLPR